MLERRFVKAELDSFRRKVVRGARQKFLPKSVSGKGSRSIRSELSEYPNSFDLDFLMEDYMEYQDKGVRGVKSGSSLAGYHYKNKMPPTSAFDKWSVRRGLAPRDAGGRFLDRNSLKFALAKHIYTHGIKPSRFFTDVFERYFKTLPEEIIEAYGLDVENFMRKTLNAK